MQFNGKKNLLKTRAESNGYPQGKKQSIQSSHHMIQHVTPKGPQIQIQYTKEDKLKKISLQY